jgi:uncharacterized membrane protein
MWLDMNKYSQNIKYYLHDREWRHINWERIKVF